MAAARFYHLTGSTLEATLLPLVTRSLAAGWRVLIRGGDGGRLDWLDEKLWLGPEDGFLAHGRAGGPHDADQPVLLTQAPGPAPNGAAALFAIDGAEIAPEEALALERACLIFDGADTAAVEAARGQWRRLAAAGVPAQYWAEENGRWVMKAGR